ncbi:MAG: chemotaxis protein CheW [Deltaproteobacteria bacterium]|nr:chemotaxis protein CheW [Deltaproteobacteria bacterium]
MSSGKELILIVSIDGCKFSINIKDLIEVTENLDLSSKSQGEECIGKVEFRGSEIPLVDIKKRLSLTEDAKSVYETAAVVRVWNEILAIPIDSVEGVFEAGSAFFPFPQMILRDKNAFTFIHDWNGEFVLHMNLPGIYSKETIIKISRDGQSKS